MTISDEFEEDYKDLLDDVLRADHRDFSQRLKDWLNFLANSPESSQIVTTLGTQKEFEDWFNKAIEKRGGMVGSGKLDWDSDKTKRLCQTYWLLKYLASAERNVITFSMSFMYASSNLNDNVDKVNEQLVEPFGRDLWKHIVRSLKENTPVATVPASDRIVTLNHNSSEYTDLIQKLDELVVEARRTNSIAAEPEYERVEIELFAGRKLLDAVNVRVSAFGAIIISSLKWLATKAVENTFSILLTAVAILIAGLFGITIPGLT